MAIIAGILTGARIKIERVLTENKAFDEKTAVHPEEVGIHYKYVLKLMVDGGLVRRTSEGRVYLTEKGRRKSHQPKSNSLTK